MTQMIKDIKLFNPSPRWKLVVDIKAAPQERVSTQPGHVRAPSIGEGMSTLSVMPTATTIVAPSNGAGLLSNGAARLHSGEASIKASKISDIVSICKSGIIVLFARIENLRQPASPPFSERAHTLRSYVDYRKHSHDH